MEVTAYVYILTNKTNSTLYVGVTTSLRKRIWQHKIRKNPNCFTARYNVNKHVYYEEFEPIMEAIAREKYIKGKSRQWKIALVNSKNSDWVELEAPE